MINLTSMATVYGQSVHFYRWWCLVAQVLLNLSPRMHLWNSHTPIQSCDVIACLDNVITASLCWIGIMHNGTSITLCTSFIKPWPYCVIVQFMYSWITSCDDQVLSEAISDWNIMWTCTHSFVIPPTCALMNKLTGEFVLFYENLFFFYTALLCQ